MSSLGKRVSLFATVSVAVLAMSGVAGAADWPQFHSDAARTGFNANETALDASNVADLAIRWSTQIAGVISSPVVVSDGKVYAGSDDGKVYALDHQNGAVLWTGQTGSGIRLAPAVGGGRVYVGSEDAVFYAFPASCSTPCAPVWTRQLGGRPTSAPAVVGGTVYVGAGSGASGEMWALDGATGAVIWRGDLSSSPAGVAVADSVVYASGPVAFPAACTTPCSPLWFGNFGGDAPPAVGGGFLYVDGGFVNNRFNAYSTVCAFSCFPVWFGATDGGSQRNVAAIAYGQVFFAEDHSRLSAFPATGCAFFCLPTWTVTTGGFLSSAAVANGVVYVGTGDSVRAFNASTGAALATIPTGDSTLTPAIADGSLYASTAGFGAGGRVMRLALPSEDTTPPVITVPPRIDANATGPSGAAVPYSASATDDVDGPVAVTCAPTSGSMFPIGTTPVNCTATDASGNTATASFTVHVKGASEQVADLIVLVDGYNLGLLGTALHDKLVKAQGFLAANKPKRACEVLDRFLAQVREQRGKRISIERADRLTADAQRIKAVIGC